jgi:hypothetical protein
MPLRDSPGDAKGYVTQRRRDQRINGLLARKFVYPGVSALEWYDAWEMAAE